VEEGTPINYEVLGKKRMQKRIIQKWKIRCR